MVASTEPSFQLDLRTSLRWAIAARRGMAAHRQSIDDLNVFPVPDCDTGTNLALTLAAGWDGLRHAERAQPQAAFEQFAAASLLQARGNSGVILSQLIRGFAEGMGEGDLTAGLERANDTARQGMSDLVEGTMVTVAAAAAHAAREVTARAAKPGLEQLAEVALAAAAEALAHTPEQLPALREAGVVDAGGAGVVVLLQALVVSLRGRQAEPFPDIVPTGAHHAASAGRADEAGWEVMSVIACSQDQADALRVQLQEVGDSVLVVGGPPQWRVHVHTLVPEQASAAMHAAGTVSNQQRNRLDVRTNGGSVQMHEHGEAAEQPRTEQPHTERPHTDQQVAVVAVVGGPGLVELVRSAGAAAVPSRGAGPRAMEQEVASAVRATHAADVIIVPSDDQSFVIAQTVQRHAEVDSTIHVVESRSAVQALAALAVADLDSGECRDGQTALEAMARASGHTRWAVVGGADNLASASGNPAAVEAALRDLLTEGSELVTIVVGAQGDRESVEPVVSQVAIERGLETQWVEGGDPSYLWMIGVE